MHKWLASLAVLALAFPVLAEAQVGRGGRGGAPARPVAGNGVEVPGWWARVDAPADVKQPMKFVPMGAGIHATTGPNAIFWDPQQEASGQYTVKATFTLNKPASHPVAYGLFIGGTDLSENSQRYTYFLIRQDGKFLLKKRNGAATSNVAGDWMDHAAIVKPDSGKAANELSIRVAKDAVTFLVNGMEVAKQPASAVDTNGVAGLRIGHGLDVQIDGFMVDQQ
jgi:hypothetical protein